MIVMQLLRQVRKRTQVPNLLATHVRVDGRARFLRRKLQQHRATGYFLRVTVFTTTALAKLADFASPRIRIGEELTSNALSLGLIAKSPVRQLVQNPPGIMDAHQAVPCLLRKP